MSTPRRLRNLLSLDDFEPAARRMLPRPLFGYISGGVETDASLRGNRAAFQEHHFVPRVLVDTRGRSLRRTALGRTCELPFGIAPMGGTALAAYEGDTVLARAAAALDIPMILSGATLTTLERVREVGPTAWFQAYLPGDAAIVTRLPHLENTGAARIPVLSRSLAPLPTARDGLDWRHLDLVRSLWKGKLVLKGVLAADDVRIARDGGVDGVIVSNPGGRQLDGSVAPLRMLPAVVAQAGAMTVMMDSGIRRGSDVLKALALGADFVFVGRPFLYAAAIAGEPGALHAARLLRDEIDRDMAFLGLLQLGQLGQLGPGMLVSATGPISV